MPIANQASANARSCGLKRWETYVAIGDSFTEGLRDCIDPEAADPHFYGWADRLAARLAAARADAGLAAPRYANLAVRGYRLQKIICQELAPALELKPDLVSLVGGGNDMILPQVRVATLIRELERAVRALRERDIDVLLVTSVDPSGAPMIRHTAARVAELNNGLWSLADRYGCFVADIWRAPQLRGWEAWADDRLHLTPAGHQFVADQAARALGILPATAPTELLPPDLPLDFQVTREAPWVRNHFFPWVKRHLRGRSSGDGRVGKYPQPVTVTADFLADAPPVDAP